MSNDQEEKILGAFEIMEDVGKGFSQKRYSCRLVVTDKRLIVDRNESIKAKMKQATIGSSVLYNYMAADARERLKWQEVDPESFMKNNEKNYCMMWDDVQAIELKGRIPLLKIYCDDLNEPRAIFGAVNPVTINKVMEFFKSVAPNKV